MTTDAPENVEALATPEELAAMATAPGDLALAALDAGDLDAARQIASRSVGAHAPLRDIYTMWNVLTVSYIRDAFGEEAAAEAMTASLAPVLRPIAELFRNGVSREAVTTLAQILRMDAVALDAVTEDADTIVLVASGWMRDRAETFPGGAQTAELFEQTVMRLCVQWFGYPPFLIEDEGAGHPVSVRIHKDPTTIPASVFSRLGVVRDEARIGAAFAVGGALLFDADERDAMCRPAFALAGEALDAGDVNLARRHFALSKTEWYPTHHFFRDWVTGLSSWISRNHGPERLWDAVEVAYNQPFVATLFGMIEPLSLREQVELLAWLFHQHGMKFEIVTSPDRIDFRTAPCGSGGRLIEEGAYAPPKAFDVIAGPRLESFGLDAMPAYCMHCPATNKAVLENAIHNGSPLFMLVDPDVVDGQLRGHCSFNIFTSMDAVPDDMFTRVGLERPHS